MSEASHHSCQLDEAQQANAPHQRLQGDAVTLSDVAKLAAKIHDETLIRWDRVEACRRQIADGTFETDERIDGAVDALMEELA